LKFGESNARTTNNPESIFFILKLNNMKKLLFAAAIGSLLLSCQKDNLQDRGADMQNQSAVGQVNTQTSNSLAADRTTGAIQLGGIGYYALPEECNSVTAGATYSVKLTGDLQGCLYVYVDNFDCSPSGTYRESGREHFVGNYNGGAGEFWTAYNFESKYEGCAENGAALGAEIFGRCQHPIVAGSGTGVFTGATGRLAFKDDVVVGNFPYTGHIQL
jgi:hypothetical protein